MRELEAGLKACTKEAKLLLSSRLELMLEQAQLQKERAELRSLERTLIPSAAQAAQGDKAFSTDMEGYLAARSATTLLWWSGYARLDAQRKVLLLLSKQADPPSAASRAVALSKVRARVRARVVRV